MTATDAARFKTRSQEVDDLPQMLKGNLEKVVQHGKRRDSIVILSVAFARKKVAGELSYPLEI